MIPEPEFRIPSLSDYEHVKRIWEDEKTMADVGGIVQNFQVNRTIFRIYADQHITE